MMDVKGITVSYNLGDRPGSFYEITVNDLATNNQSDRQTDFIVHDKVQSVAFLCVVGMEEPAVEALFASSADDHADQAEFFSLFQKPMEGFGDGSIF
jgi:hypothetical protein